MPVITHTYCLHVWKNDLYLNFLVIWIFVCDYLDTGQKYQIRKIKFYSLLTDCIDTFHLVILCEQYIKFLNPYFSFQYLLVTVWQRRYLQSMLFWPVKFSHFGQKVWNYRLMNTVLPNLNTTVRQITEMFEWPFVSAKITVMSQWIVTNGTFLFYDHFFVFICKISLTVLNYSDTRLRIKWVD